MISSLSNHYLQMEQNYGKNAYWISFFVCTYLVFLQLLLCCEEFLLEKYAVWQLTMMPCLVVKQNFQTPT